MNPSSPEDLDPREIAFMNATSSVKLRMRELSFEEGSREYRRIEAEFVRAYGDDERNVLDIRQRITADILELAYMKDQPHEVCRALWEETLERGFPVIQDFDMRHLMTCIYARCCQENAEFAAGLAVIEPLIPEIEHALQDEAVSKRWRSLYKRDLKSTLRLRDELAAGIQDPEPYEPEHEKAFAQAIADVEQRVPELSFEEAVREYRRIEAEFVRAYDADEDEDNVIRVRRRISTPLLRLAHRTQQPHEVCRAFWEEIVERGFTSTEGKYEVIEIYARCCQRNAEHGAGLAVLGRAIAELEAMIERARERSPSRPLYEKCMKLLSDVQDELRAGAASSATALE